MIFGNKSDVKKHFSSKRSMFSHRLFVDDAPGKKMELVRGEEQFNDQSPPAKVEEPNVIPLKG
jgi:hypothetical protein